MKKILSHTPIPGIIRISAILLPILFLLLSSLQSIAQQQTKKGRWFISHTLGGFQYEVERSKEYNGSGTLVNETKVVDFGFKSAFKGPDYGNLNVNSVRYESMNDKYDINRFVIRLQPVAGIFINDNFLLGASLLINVERANSERGNAKAKVKTTSLGLGPLARYYFGGSEKARFFGGVESRYSFLTYNDRATTVNAANTSLQEFDVDDNSLLVIPHFGYAWFAGKRWSFELRADYRYERSTRDARLSFSVNGVQQTGYPQISERKTTVSRPGIYAGVGLSL